MRELDMDTLMVFDVRRDALASERIAAISGEHIVLYEKETDHVD